MVAHSSEKMKFKNWKFVEQASGEFVYQNIKRPEITVTYGQYSKNHKIPYTSRVGFFELRIGYKVIKSIDFKNRVEAKEYAFKYMEYAK